MSYPVVKLAEVCEFRKGKKPKAFVSADTPNGKPYILIEHFGGSRSLFTDDQHCTSCETDDTLIVCDGARTGLCSIGNAGYIGSTIAALVPDKTKIHPQYLFHFVSSNYDLINSRVRGAAVPHIDREFFLSLAFAMPPLPEQQRIVRILDEADALRQLRARADTRTNHFIPALFNEMFGDPEHSEKMKWNFQRVDSFAKVSYGLADKLNADTLPSQGTRIITISNVLLDGTFDFSVERYSVVDEHTRAKARLQKSDLLFNWRNGSLAHVGKTAIWEEDFDGEVLHVSFLLKIRPDLNQVDPYYLWVLLNRLRAIGFFTRSSRFQVNNKFNATELAELKLPLPPLSLQREFAARVAEVRALQAQQARSRQRLEDLFQALLHRAFAGEL